jgi:HEAT repeats
VSTSSMPDERTPNQIIEDLAASRRHLSDAEFLAELEAFPPLADEKDKCWDSDAYWHNAAYLYLALWEIAGERRLRSAIPLILERACFGDPGEMMRNLCHLLEGIVVPNWAELFEPCVAALSSPRAGTRLWAAHELQRLRDPRAIPALERAAEDKVEEVREQVLAALESTRNCDIHGMKNS